MIYEEVEKNKLIEYLLNIFNKDEFSFYEENHRDQFFYMLVAKNKISQKEIHFWIHTTEYKDKEHSVGASNWINGQLQGTAFLLKSKKLETSIKRKIDNIRTNIYSQDVDSFINFIEGF